MSRLAETGRAMGGLVTGPVGLVWDTARMVNGIDDEWESLKDDLGDFGAGAAAPFTLLLDPLTPVFDALYTPYKQGVSPLLSTIGLGAQKLNPFVDGMGDSLNWGDPSSIWDKAHKVSPGQAIVPGIHVPGLDFFTWNPAGIFTNDWGAIFDGDFGKFAKSMGNAWRPWTKEDLETLDDQNGGATWNIITGLTDAAATWFLDPTIIAGKAVKVGRAVKWATDISGMSKNAKVIDHLATATGKPTYAAADLKANPSDILTIPAADHFIDYVHTSVMADPLKAEQTFNAMFKGNNQGRGLAALLTDAATDSGKAGVTQVLKVAAGDMAEWEALKANRAGLAFQIQTLENKSSLLDDALKEHRATGDLSAATRANFTTITAPGSHYDPVLMQTHLDELNDTIIPGLKQNDDYLDRLVGDITRPPGEAAHNSMGIYGSIHNDLPFSTGGLERFARIDKQIRKGERRARRMDFSPRVAIIDRATGYKGLNTLSAQLKAYDAGISLGHATEPALPTFMARTYYPKSILALPVRAWRVSQRAMMDARPQGWADLNDSNRAAEEVSRMLMRVKGLKPDMVTKYSGDVARAVGEEQLTLAIKAAETYAIHIAAINYNIPVEGAVAFATGQLTERDKHWEKFFGASKNYGELSEPNKKMIHGLGIDGVPESTPYNLKQLENRMPIMDMDSIQKDFARKGTLFRSHFGPQKDNLVNFADWGLRTWKANVLLRGMGFPVKVLADDGARYWAKLDALSSSPDRGLAKSLFASGGIKGVGLLPRSTLDWWRGQPIHPTQLHAWRMAKQKGVPYERVIKKRSGEDTIHVNGIDFQGLFGGLDTDLTRMMFSGQWQAMENRSRSVHNIIRNMSGGVRVTPTEDPVRHLHAWRDAFNFQLSQDPITRRILQGQTDDRITKWFTNQHSLRKRNTHLGRDPEETVITARALVDSYFPPSLVAIPGMRAKILDKAVTVDDLAKVSMADRPPVHDIDFALNLQGGGLSKQLGAIMDKTYNMVINVPHGAMVSHPLARQLYQSRVQQLSRMMLDQRVASGAHVLHPSGGHFLTGQEINQIQASSKRYALKQVGEIVMDLSAQSSAAHALRFVMPFFDAWRESMMKWSKLFYEDPTRIERIGQYRDSWGHNFTTVDANGNELDPDNPVDPEGRAVPIEDQHFVMRLPKSLIKGVPGLEHMGSIAVPRGTVDFVFQGQRWYEPDFGPMVKVPVSSFLTDKPELEDAFKTLGILPDGAVDPNTLIFGSTYRNLYKAWNQPETDKAYMQSMLYIALGEHQKFLDGEKHEDVNWDEVKSKAATLWATKLVAGIVSPISMQFQPKGQPLIDEYRRLLADKSVGPENADRVFYEKNPEMFVWAATMSKNNAHLPASQLAMKRTRQYRDLISKYPDMASVIIGNVEGSNEFSPSVYQWQMDHLMGSGSGKNFRGFQSAREAFESVQTREGWVKYQKTMDGLTATLNSRGLVDFQDTGAEDLLTLKQQFTDQLAEENKAWGTDFFTTNQRKVPDFITATKEILQEKKVTNDPNRQDIQGLRDYVGMRDEFINALKKRREEGGSADITAKQNADLYLEWRHSVGQLVESNTQFSTIWQRYLERDALQEAGFHNDSFTPFPTDVSI